MYKNSTLLIYLLISSALYAQKEYGFEYQHGFGKSYNSNSIGASLEKFNSGKGSLQVVFHYTWDIFFTEKKTQGISDFGVSIGYRYGFGYGDSGNLLGGIRATFSHLAEKNHTKLTPSVEFGYHYTFNNFNKGGFVTPTLAFAYDIPVGKEKAEDFEGPLFIPRVGIGYRY